MIFFTFQLFYSVQYVLKIAGRKSTPLIFVRQVEKRHLVIDIYTFLWQNKRYIKTVCFLAVFF